MAAMKTKYWIWGTLITVGMVYLAIKEPSVPVIASSSDEKKKTSGRKVSKEKSIEKSLKFPLVLGSKGKAVENLQVWLLRNYGWDGVVSGILDERTLNRMKKYLKTDQLTEEIYNQYRMDKPVEQQVLVRV